MLSMRWWYHDLSEKGEKRHARNLAALDQPSPQSPIPPSKNLLSKHSLVLALNISSRVGSSQDHVCSKAWYEDLPLKRCHRAWAKGVGLCPETPYSTALSAQILLFRTVPSLEHWSRPRIRCRHSRV